MTKVTLGRTGITANKNGFGALPVQRVASARRGRSCGRPMTTGSIFLTPPEAIPTARKNWLFSQRRARPDHYRHQNPVYDGGGLLEGSGNQSAADENRLCGYPPVSQPGLLPEAGDGTGLYEAMEEARRQGKIRFIGLTNHRYHVAVEAIQSGLYDTIQFPFCYLSGEQELEIVRLCKERNLALSP